MDSVAFVENTKGIKIITNCVLIKVNELNNFTCNCFALLDTGSPISFISPMAYKNFFSCNQFVTLPSHSYKAVNNIPINITDILNSTIKLDALPNFSASIQLHILSDKLSSADIIIGRDFLENHKITVIINSSSKDSENKLQLLSEVASVDIIENSSNKTASLFEEISIDFDYSIRNQLITIFQEVGNTEMPILDDDYFIKICLRDESVYAFAPRRFA